MSCETLDRDTLTLLSVAAAPPSTMPHEPAAPQGPALVIGQLCKETVKSRSSLSLVSKVKPLELVPDSNTQTCAFAPGGLCMGWEVQRQSC